MTQQLITTGPDMIAALIDDTDLAAGTKAQYKKVISQALKSNVDLKSRESIRAFARQLSPSSKSYLKAVITLLTDETKAALEANVTRDNLADTQVLLMRLNAIARAIKVEKAKGQKAHTWLSQTEVKALLETCNQKIVKGRRDRIVLGILTGAGLRREELKRLTFDDILPQGESRTVLNVTGKGAKDRIVPIKTELAEALGEWRLIVAGGKVARRVTKGGRLGDAISAIGIFNIVRAAGREIGKSDLAPHDLRRSFAQLGLEAGISITQISYLLGHSSLTTTQRYLNLQVDLDKTVGDFVPFV